MGRNIKERVFLLFPKKVVNYPITAMLIKEKNVFVNILKAEIMPNEDGYMIVDIEGKEKDIEEAKKFLKEKGVSIFPISQKIIINDKECINCGSCVGVCIPGALSLNENFKLEFKPEKCILCSMCKDACPVGAIEIIG
jgi:ferredoxin